MPAYPAHPNLRPIITEKILKDINEDIKQMYGDGWSIKFDKPRQQYQVRHAKAMFPLKASGHFQEAWCWLYFAAEHQVCIKTGTPRELPFDPNRTVTENEPDFIDPNDPSVITLDFTKEQ